MRLWMPIRARRLARRGACVLCGCAHGGAGVHASMQDGPPCLPFLVDASSTDGNARHGWPDVGCATWRALHALCPSAAIRPASHGVSPGGLPGAHAAVARRMKCAAQATTPFHLSRLQLCSVRPSRPTHPHWEHARSPQPCSTSQRRQ